MSIIKDPSLAEHGRQKIDWVYDCMDALSYIEQEFKELQPFARKKVAMSIHMEAKTARLALLLKSLGAKVYATGCNPLSTQDDVAAGLASLGVEVYAIHDVDSETYKMHLLKTLESKPDLIIDDGGDLLNAYCELPESQKWRILGGCEETTTGVIRLKAREKADALPFPMMNVNDAKCKHLYDNVFGTGQSTIDAIMHTTNNIIAGKVVVVAGFGHCGRGIAKRMRGMGAKVIVTEIDPVKAIEANLDGYEVMTMLDASPLGDFFITATGCKDVITAKHFPLMKHNAKLCNSGHFNVEINLDDLAELATDIFPRRDNIIGYKLKNGNTINVLAEGRLVNLAAGNGHPAEIMDTSFAIQTLSLKYVSEHSNELKNKVYEVPSEIDDKVASIKLKSMDITIDQLTKEQKKYLESWEV